MRGSDLLEAQQALQQLAAPVDGLMRAAIAQFNLGGFRGRAAGPLGDIVDLPEDAATALVAPIGD